MREIKFRALVYGRLLHNVMAGKRTEKLFMFKESD